MAQKGLHPTAARHACQRPGRADAAGHGCAGRRSWLGACKRAQPGQGDLDKPVDRFYGRNGSGGGEGV